MKLRDKVVWITGASSGIGAAIAVALSRQGCRLVLSARRMEKLEQVRDACQDPTRVMLLPADLADETSHADVVERALDSFGRIDAVVHSAGISQRSRAIETGVEVDRRIFEINYFATVSLTKKVLPHMLARGSGSFVVISSVSGKVGNPGRTAYAASKHALHGFFDSLRAETHDLGLRTTIVCPGYVRTEIGKAALTGDGKPSAKVDEHTAKGVSAEKVADRVVRAMQRDEREVFVGGKEVGVAFLKRLSPGLADRVMQAFGNG